MNPSEHSLPRLSIRRREVLAASALGLLGAGARSLALGQSPKVLDATFQAGGVKVGEVTDRSAIVWARLTASPVRYNVGVDIRGKVKKGKEPELTTTVDLLEGACQGAVGKMRISYVAERADVGTLKIDASAWFDVTEEGDFSHQFHLRDLTPDTRYNFSVQTAGPRGDVEHKAVEGSFRTAPAADSPDEVKFCVLTCLMYADLDDRDGFHIFPAIGKLAPRFLSFTGDNVYYDSEMPRAVTPALARYHWQRMYSLPRHVELLKSLPTYWQKDDHDTLSDDSWPGRSMGKLDFAEGQRIFRQQVPLGESIYRTMRWGKHLQVWLTDVRDFRTPNSMPDGPEKTIWGAEQKAWFKKTVAASDATWKVLINPTPLVGPDRTNKNDNHANQGFRHEGDEIRGWLKENAPSNLFVICGDRHWQYHSIHPTTGLNEFACGAGSDPHAGGTPGYDAAYHQFHRVKGGFVSVTARGDEIVFRHHDVHGEVVNEVKKTNSV